MNSFRLLAKAIVIGVVAVVFGTTQVVQAGINVWTSHGPYGVAIFALAIDPTTPSTLYAAGSGGVFQSINSGDSWSAVNTGLPADVSGNGYVEVDALAIDPTTPSTLYAGTGAGVYKSTNSGGSWVNTGLSNLSVGTLAIDPTTPSTLYAAGNGVYQSTNSGGSWSAVNTGLPVDPSRGYPSVYALAIDPTTPSTLYAGMFGGMFQSTTSGASWSAVSITGLPVDLFGYPEVDVLAIDPSTPSTLYAAPAEGVFQSINSGDSWSAINTGLPVDVSGNGYARVGGLAIDPRTPSTLYAGTTYPGGVYKSTNSGGSWSAVNTGLPVDPSGGYPGGVYALAIDPTMPNTLYAGTLGAGAFSIHIQQVAICVGDCDGSGEVTVDELITLVNIDLGTSDASACPNGIPSGGSVDITLIIQAVNDALTNCPAP